MRNNTADFLTFALEGGVEGIQVDVQDEDVWLSQKSHGNVVRLRQAKHQFRLPVRRMAPDEPHLPRVPCPWLPRWEGDARGVCSGKGLRLAEISLVGRSGFAEVFRFGRIGRERPGCGTGRRRRRETGLPIGEIPAENPRAAGCSCCKMTHGVAKVFAESEFERCRVIQDRLYESDFDKMVQLALFDGVTSWRNPARENNSAPSATLYANLTRPALRSLSGCFTMSRNGWNVPREPPR